jgi:hypothetical protein
MAKIGNTLLPPELNRRLVELLEDIPETQLEQAGREFLSGGFTRAAAIRKRLATLIQGEAALPPWLEEMLLDFIPGKSLVETLSTTFLGKMVGPLADAIGREDLLLSLLTDLREPVKSTGRDGLRTLHLKHDPDAQKLARDLLADLLDIRVLNPLDLTVDFPEDWTEQSGPAPTSVPAETWNEKDLSAPLPSSEKLQAEQQQKIEKLERYLHDEKRRGKERQKEFEEQHKAEQGRWLAEKDALRDRLAKTEAQRDALQSQIQQLEANQAAAIRKGVEEETSFLVRPWLNEPARVEQAVQETHGVIEDLLARAERAIQMQAGQDRHTGNRLELQRRLADLRQARNRLADAQRHAIQPLAELGRVTAGLDAEIARVERILGEGIEEDSLAGRIMARISQANEAAQLRVVSDLLKVLGENELLPERDHRSLYEILFRKFSLLEERSGHDAAEEETDEGWSLRRLLLQNRGAVVLIDGHNTLFCLEETFGRFFENEHPGSAARDALTRSVAKLVENSDQVETVIVFDGPDMQTGAVAKNVRIEYSGGTGKNRADERIAAELRFKSLERSAKRCFVVSNDKAVRQDALRYAARFVPVEAFAVLLGDFAALP